MKMKNSMNHEHEKGLAKAQQGGKAAKDEMNDALDAPMANAVGAHPPSDPKPPNLGRAYSREEYRRRAPANVKAGFKGPLKK